MQRILIFLVFFVLSCFSHSDEPPQQVRYQQIQERFFYQVELLQHALDLTAKEYGEAKLFANSTSLKKYVGIPDEVALARGLVDVIFSATSEKREERFIAVKVPLLQGMLGFRLLMATRESDLQLASAPELENFRRRFIGGVGLYWEDFRIYSHNQLVTKTVKQYELLYPLLDSGQIDYFTLGLNEIFVEKEIYSKQFPNLVINSDIAFFYPYPFYYFVHPSRSELAKRIEVGLNKALADGSFRRIFERHFHDESQRLKELNLKKIYYLDNPTLVTLPTMKFQWWLESPPRLR